jgi:hypothetical protein
VTAGADLGAVAPQPGLRPEESATFRAAQLLLLLGAATEAKHRLATIERIAYYDFFAANPFIMVAGAEPKDVTARRSLRLAGFNQGQLSYAAAGQRFVSRRQRIQHDLGHLVALGLCALDDTANWVATDRGLRVATQLDALYADAFRVSARLALTRLGRLSDAALRRTAEGWLGTSWLLLDFTDDVLDAAASGSVSAP